MVDNFKLIKALLEFPDNDIYYYLKLIIRGKDNPGLTGSDRLVKSYFICSLEELNRVEEEVKKLCSVFNARAYINLSPKSLKKTTLLQLKHIADRLNSGDFNKIWRTWNNCAGKIKGEKSRWIVDCDNMSLKEIEKVYSKIKTCDGNTIEDFSVIIPTKSGYHLITEPFNLQQFKEKYPDIDVYKNNPTLLYCL